MTPSPYWAIMYVKCTGWPEDRLTQRARQAAHRRGQFEEGRDVAWNIWLAVWFFSLSLAYHFPFLLSITSTSAVKDLENREKLQYDTDMEIVQHPFAPIYSRSSHTLLLGTMPSPQSRVLGFYYAHPQNRFWSVLAAVYGQLPAKSNADRHKLILQHHLALWDVLSSCEINGASDSSIRAAFPNDIVALLTKTCISRIFCTGQRAGQLYHRLLEDKTGLPCNILPSTSSANCRISFSELVQVYSDALSKSPHSWKQPLHLRSVLKKQHRYPGILLEWSASFAIPKKRQKNVPNNSMLSTCLLLKKYEDFVTITSCKRH